MIRILKSGSVSDGLRIKDNKISPKTAERYRELLFNGKTKAFHRVAISFSIQAAQQLSGINMVFTYANKILADSFNLAPGLSHLIAACGGSRGISDSTGTR